MSRRLIAICLLVLIVGGGLIAVTAGLFANDPAEVSLTDRTSAPGGAGKIEEFDGTWTVDNTSGSLDEEPPTSTFAGYRVKEELANFGANTAVGRTQDVEGTMAIDGNTITDVDLTVDLTTLKSDKEMRDNALGSRGLESERFPEATFTLSEPIELDEEPAENEKIEAEATGDFTLHGVTKEVTFPIEAVWSGDTITVASTFEVKLQDYGMEPPTTMIAISVADEGTMEMQLLFKKS